MQNWEEMSVFNFYHINFEAGTCKESMFSFLAVVSPLALAYGYILNFYEQFT